MDKNFPDTVESITEACKEKVMKRSQTNRSQGGFNAVTFLLAAAIVWSVPRGKYGSEEKY